LKGKDSIKPFLDVVMIANDGMRHEIEFVRASDNKEKDEKIALVTFERGEKVKVRYTSSTYQRHMNCAFAISSMFGRCGLANI
jgi:hypothetical protein